MYLFPRLRLPQKAMDAAKAANTTPDQFYCLALLGEFPPSSSVLLGDSLTPLFVSCSSDETGICLVPGDGFGQVEGQVHFRTTALSPGVEEYVGAIENFHKTFMQKYKDA